MKILMTAHTLDEEGAHYPNETFELRDELAREWIKVGWCLEVKEEVKEEEKKVERAVAPKHETATAKAQRGGYQPEPRSPKSEPLPPPKSE